MNPRKFFTALTAPALLGLGSVALSGALVACQSEVEGPAVSSSSSDTATTGTQEQGTASSPASAGDVLAGLQYWDSTGTLTTGTMTSQGTLNEQNTFPGAGYYSSASNTPTASEIASGSTILGVAGSYTGSFDANTASSAYRIDTSTILLGELSPPGASSRVQPLLSDEIAGDATFTGNSRLVPDPGYDDDGRYAPGGSHVANYGYLVTVVGRPTKVCGLSGTTAAREADCVTENGASASWSGSDYGQSGEASWSLVTLYSGGGEGSSCSGGGASGCFEVWQDQRTQQIWSDVMTAGSGYAAWTSGYNWFQAAGYSSSTSTTSVTYYEGGTPAGTGKTYNASCSTPGSQTCQPATPISVCADATAIAGNNGVATYSNPAERGPATGNLGSTHQWRLPTIEDWEQANVDGVRKVLPNMDQDFWSASSVSFVTGDAWVFGGDDGSVFNVGRYGPYVVRCVGRQ